MQLMNLRLGAIGLIGLGLLGCDNDPNPPAVPSTSPSFDLRVVHAVPDAPNVDVLIDGDTFSENLGFKESTNLVRQSGSGTASVQVDAIVPGGAATVIGPADIDFQDGNSYNVLAVGTVATIEPLIVSNPRAPISADSVRVQVVHGAPSAPQVDVYVTTPGAVLAQSGPLGSFSFKENLGPVEVPAGDYQIRVTLPSDPNTVVFDSGTVALPSTDLFIVAVDNTRLGASPISLLVANNVLGTFEILDAATPAEFRVIHTSPDAPNVDVVVNDDFMTPVLADVPYPVFSDFISVPPDTYNVKVTAAGNPGAIVIDADLTLDAGQQYSVYATDVLANITPVVLTDDRRPVATEGKVRIVHFAPGAGLVDLYVTTPGADISGIAPTFAGVDFGDETGYVGLAEGSYDVTVTVAGTKTAAIGPATIIVAAGDTYTAVARDATGGGGPFGLILMDDFN